MKALIVSDTHGSHRNLERVIEKEQPLDLLIHLGDVEGGEDYIEAIADCPVHVVAGNNDFFSELPREEEFFVGGSHIFIHMVITIMLSMRKPFKRRGEGKRCGHRNVWTHPSPCAFSGRRGYDPESRKHCVSASDRQKSILYDHGSAGRKQPEIRAEIHLK